MTITSTPKRIRVWFDVSVDIECLPDTDKKVFVDVQKLEDHIDAAIQTHLSANAEAVGAKNKLVSIAVRHTV